MLARRISERFSLSPVIDLKKITMAPINPLIFRVSIVGLVFLLSCCKGPVQDEKAQAQTSVDRLEQQKIGRSLMFAIIADSRIETLSGYVVANNMADLFSKDPGPFLFFTPTNEAFEGVNPATLKLWSNQRNGIVKSLINKHLARVDTLASDLSYYVDQKIQTLGGMQVKVIQDQDQYYLEDVKGGRARIDANPMRMDNGYIFYIDQLLHRQ